MQSLALGYLIFSRIRNNPGPPRGQTDPLCQRHSISISISILSHFCSADVISWPFSMHILPFFAQRSVQTALTRFSFVRSALAESGCYCCHLDGPSRWYINFLIYEVQFLWASPRGPWPLISLVPSGTTSLFVDYFYFSVFFFVFFFHFFLPACLRLWQELSLLIESSSMAAGDKSGLGMAMGMGSGRLSKASSWASFDEPAADGLTWMWSWLDWTGWDAWSGQWPVASGADEWRSAMVRHFLCFCFNGNFMQPQGILSLSDSIWIRKGRGGGDGSSGGDKRQQVENK